VASGHPRVRYAKLRIMKEIDFLPEWYVSGKRQQVRFRIQYIALGGLLAIMLAWDLAAGRSVSRMQAELAMLKPPSQVVAQAQQFSQLTAQAAALEERAEQIGRLDSRIDLASVIGELSFLVEKGVVLSEVLLTAEQFKAGGAGSPSTGSTVRPAGSAVAGRDRFAVGSVRFRVLLKGVAASADKVAGLVVRLEDSPYFRDVTASCRNKGLRTTEGDTSLDVSEFEVTSFLANYKDVAVAKPNAKAG